MVAIRSLSLTGVILALLVLAATTAMAAPRVTVNGQPVSFTATPIQLDGTVMVPVREICQALGAEVYWNASTQTVTANRGNYSVSLTIDEDDALANGRTVALEVPAMVYRGTTMVPLAFVCKSLGAEVRWSEATQTASIFTQTTGENDRQSRQTLRIPEGTVIPVSLDTALDDSTSNATDGFAVTVVSGRDGDAEFPRGTRFIGTATGLQRESSLRSHSRDVGFLEAQLPDGSSVAIDGSLIVLDDSTVTRSSDGRLTATHASARAGGRPIRVALTRSEDFGVLLNRAVTYDAPQAFAVARNTYLAGGAPVEDRWSSIQRVAIPRGTVIPVSFDTALTSWDSRARDDFSVTVRSRQDGDAEFPRGAQLLGTVVTVQRAGAGQPGSMHLGFHEVRLPDGRTAQIDGSLITIDDKTVTRSSDGRLVATVEPGWGWAQPKDVVVASGTLAGVRMDRDVTYGASAAFIDARETRTGLDYGERWAGTQTVSIPLGTVIPVSLDQALSSATARLGDPFSVTVNSNQDGDAEFPLGTRLEGVIVGVQRLDGDNPGTLDLSFREARLPNGTTVAIDGALISLDDESVTRSEDGRLTATAKAKDDRLLMIGIGAGAGMLIGKLFKQNLIVGGLLGAAAGYFYNELTKDEVKPTDVVVNAGTVFGVRMDRGVSYSAHSTFAEARSAYLTAH